MLKNLTLKSTIGQFRTVALLEGSSLILLIGFCMPLKYMMGIPEPNQIVGMIHGILFILYVLLMIKTANKYDWKYWTTAITFLASFIPFGTFIADKYIFRKY